MATLKTASVAMPMGPGGSGDASAGTTESTLFMRCQQERGGRVVEDPDEYGRKEREGVAIVFGEETSGFLGG